MLVTEYHNKIVKVIVKNKSNPLEFEKFIDKLHEVRVADLKIIENYDFNNGYLTEDKGLESEDTFSILNRYIEEAEFSLIKPLFSLLSRKSMKKHVSWCNVYYYSCR